MNLILPIRIKTNQKRHAVKSCQAQQQTGAKLSLRVATPLPDKSAGGAVRVLCPEGDHIPIHRRTPHRLLHLLTLRLAAVKTQAKVLLSDAPDRGTLDLVHLGDLVILKEKRQ